ncbi:MAG: HAMP domain-containing histidine kinase [Clostridia bacterium]|nr:HAMP domain-containing histidine kinase [Clostridia bacterium]
MNFEIRFKSIAVRWFINVFAMVVATVVIAIVAFSVFFATVYIERIETLAEDYTFEFETLSSTNTESFEDAAVNLSGDFEYKSKVEVQVIDNKGKVLVSTTGFQPTDERMPDYEKALYANSGAATYRGKNSAGESILAKTTVIKNADGDILGAYRWISSMTATDKYIGNTVAILVLIGLGVIGFSAFSGIYFINSIVRPIRDVSNTARKIAMGDFETKIDIERNDEIGELCDTINYMATELREAETIKNDFISSVSHELRTPLTAIRGWGETAKMSIGTDEELVAKGIDVVLSEADRLSSLVEELLDFSRMQSGRLTVNTMPVDASYLLSSAADMYTELARQQGIELSYTKPSEASIIMGDGDRLKQVFINIIDNAVKYTEKGGLVLVTETREEGCVRIVVKDTGVGIPAADLDHVKEKFFKSNKTVRGSGIGLAVADEIIKQHQGLLFLESTEGVGTAVTIVLPLYEEPETEAEPEGEEEVIPVELLGSGGETEQNETETKEEENG